MPLRKLLPFLVVALTLAACSSDTITGPASTDVRAAKPHYETADGLGSLGGGG